MPMTKSFRQNSSILSENLHKQLSDVGRPLHIRDQRKKDSVLTVCTLFELQSHKQIGGLKVVDCSWKKFKCRLRILRGGLMSVNNELSRNNSESENSMSI